MELRDTLNNECVKNCNSDKRKDFTEYDICKLVKSEIDKLPVRCVGKWAYDKIYRLTQYFGIFASGMKNKGTKNYIEICSGPGRCILRETGNEIDGTPLAIVNHPSFKYIDKALFIDLNEVVVDCLNIRFKDMELSNAKAITGDYTDTKGLSEILDEIKYNSLNLVFIDPTDCSVPFATIAFLKRKLGRMDLIFNFAQGSDLKRNIRKAINNQDYACRQKYTRFLGSEEYFNRPEIVALASETINEDKLVEHFYAEYQNNLKRIGLIHTDRKLVRIYYSLLFATAHKLGIRFWNEAQAINPNEQREFKF